MIKKLLIIFSGLICIGPLLAANAQKPLLILSITTPWLSAAGDSDYGENHSDGPIITNPVVQSHSKANLKVSILYMNDNRTTHIGYSNYVTNWDTQSLTTNDFNAPYSYKGSNSLATFSFTHGYNIQFTKTMLVNIHAGFNYKVLRSTTELNGTPITGKKPGYLQHGISDFSGFGPSIGFTLQRKIFNHFTFSNQADLSLAYGAIKTSSIQADNLSVRTSPSHNILVPGLDMTIALGYANTFNKHYIGIDAGMLFKQLFNVSNTHDGASNQYQDLAFYGPFLRLRYGL